MCVRARVRVCVCVCVGGRGENVKELASKDDDCLYSCKLKVFIHGNHMHKTYEFLTDENISDAQKEGKNGLYRFLSSLCTSEQLSTKNS